MERLRCSDCQKFIRYSYDSRTTFGCADPEAPEPYDPDSFCRKCSNKMYKRLLKGYLCCQRSGDWQKSDAEMKAAKEAGLEWIGSSSLIDTYSGNDIMNRYIRTSEKYKDRYIPYLEYHAKRREAKLCKCLFELKDDKCSRCGHSEVMCLCKYSRSYGLAKLLKKPELAIF